MEVIFKILYLLSISSATICLQLLPTVKVNAPPGLDLSIGGINPNIKNVGIQSNGKKLFVPVKKCYCIPSNSNSRIVTSKFNAQKEKIQRLVIYLYKTNGALVLYIPNKVKQASFPDLNFDGYEGDTLKIVTKETIVDIFDTHISQPQETVVSVSQNIVTETDTLNVLNNNVGQHNVISGNGQIVIGNTEHTPGVPSNSNIISVEQNPIYIGGDNVSVNKESHGIVTNNLDQSSQSITSSSETVSASSQSISTSQSKPQEVINQVTVIDDQNVNMIPASSQTISTSSQSISTSQSNPQEIINQVTVIDGQDLNTIPESSQTISTSSHSTSMSQSNSQGVSNQVTVIDGQDLNTIPESSQTISTSAQSTSMSQLKPQEVIKEVTIINGQDLNTIPTTSQIISSSSQSISASQSKPQEVISPITLINGQDVNVIPELSQTISSSSQSISASQSKPQGVINHVTVIDGQNMNIIPNLVDSNQQQISSTSNIQILGDQEKYKKIMWDKIINLGDFNSAVKIVTPENSQQFADILLQQNQHKPELTIKPYIPFNDWFDIQLKRVVLYNLETESKIVELRKQIQQILQNNGMSISLKGIVKDSNQKLVRMNNLMLRPILIGNPIDPQTLLDPSSGQDPGVLYVQLIEVILVSPPKLLGTLIMGKVYLPRSIIRTSKVKIVKENKNENVEGKSGCITCRVNIPQHPHSGVSYPGSGFHYPDVSKPYQTYIPYYAVPYRPKVLNNGLPYVEGNGVNVDAERMNGVNQGRSGIFDTLLGTLSPILYTPSRRLIGGSVPQGPTTGPRTYPNDDQPGFRIIGGNAATSSGTPLAIKGRSSFEHPSYII